MRRLKMALRKKELRVTTTICFVRHGEAAATWEKARDPGLSVLGAQQAREVALHLDRQIPRARLYSSPLQRTRETSKPLADLWQREVDIAPALAEVPSGGLDLAKRRAWLDGVLAGNWSDQSETLQRWRADIVDFTRARQEDSVFFTHFVVINAIVSAIEGRDNVVLFRPDFCSITKIRLSGGEMEIIEKGREAITIVR